tara:strand:+ start:474 stop:908 length:435 start_codon:yes stop_codon:yes gene_type:complete
MVVNVPLRRRRKCGVCGRTSHNRRTCPIRVERTPTKNWVLKRKSLAAQNSRIIRLVPTGKWSKFKIGITGNPDTRATQQDYQIYSEMILLHKTSSEKIVRQWEKDTAEIVRKYYSRCANQVGSLGSGPLTERGPYYLYLVRRRR